jgi:arginyl-tRNA synthetase
MKPVLETAITDVLTELGVEECSFVVEHPTELAHGDYACNVALVVAKQLGQSPRAVAETIAAKLANQIEYVERIEIAGPGFLNFYLHRDFFAQEIARANEAGEGWGRNTLQAGEVVLLEYTSPNLFKPLHVGNLVGNIIGESFARLFEYGGATVHRMNYPSDIGLTVAKGVWGLQRTAGDPSDISALGEAYRTGNTAYEEDEAAKQEIIAINKALYAGSDESLNRLRAQGITTSKARLDALCALLGTTFDAVITESEASAPGAAIVKEHTGTVFTESEGAVVYEGEKVGLHTRVFLNSAGLPTYEAKDVGHFTLKDATYPNWTQSIIVTGNEQTEYFKVVYAALRELFPAIGTRSLEHIPTGFLTLTTGKMSSRKGNVLTGESLLEEMMEAARERAAETRTDNLETLTKQVAVAALKYQILRYGIGSDIVFDKAKALSFEGDSGPYLQYTSARIGSVLEKATELGIATHGNAPDVPYEIERLLYRFPEVVDSALAERAPNKMAGFLIELASSFNAFYAHEKIADVTDVHAGYKVRVAEAVQQTLNNGLWTLGIEAPERM